jgi:hypothetical protein
VEDKISGILYGYWNKEKRNKNMKLFMAIDFADIVPIYYDKTENKLNVLISYQYISGQAVKLTKLYRDKIDQLYLDSGAFSASTGKSIITISEYRRYLQRYGKYFDAVFNLDDDFTNPDHNYNNQVYLEKGLQGTGILPIPVVHDPEKPFEELKKYADQGHSYIAIGSSEKLPDDTFMKIKDQYPDLKIHMFGNFNRRMLFTHKPYSADSAEYVHAAGYGNILYWDPNENKEYKIWVGGVEKEDPSLVHFNQFEKQKELEEFLFKTFQFEYKHVLASAEARWIVNLYFFKQLEDAINRS